MLITIAICAGFVLDLLLGDPPFLPHPVVLMGKYISWFERRIRPRFPNDASGERRAGRFLVFSLMLLTALISGIICLAAYRIHPYLFVAAEVFWCFQALAMKGLKTESMRVYRALADGDLPGARSALSRIVGRDTQSLNAEGIAKAAVETVAENFSDGVAAPLLYMIIGGAPLALLYKAVNTMDSMVGYRNERYEHFGRCAAKTDDAFNFIPSRIAALFFVLSAGLTGFSARDAYRIRKRDANKHASPNAGQTEAACAGALGVRLGGDAVYFGKLHEKAFLGDATHPCEAEDIVRANRMMYTAGVLLFAACVIVRCGALFLWYNRV
ncbi:MAG: cobalamin biosynthesis protein CobD [Lachnospiraceae bacterium]|nr:cobalamin biosynthesis protein CobD [Lachnospiraceae bacterium]